MAKKGPTPAETKAPFWTTRRTRLGLAAVLVIGMLLRLVLVVQINETPEVRSMVLDTEQYQSFAQHLLETGTEHPDMSLMNPLYPMFLATFWAVVGPSPGGTGLLQALLDTGTIFLVFFMARRLFGPGVGLLAGACYAFYGMAILLSGLLLATTLVVFLMTSSLTLCLEGLCGKQRWLLFPAGLLMATATLGRPNLLIAVIGAPILSTLLLKRRAGYKKALILLAVFGAGFAIPMIANASRNLSSHGRLSPFSANGGVNFYIGNGPDADGRFHPPKGMSSSPLKIVTTSIEKASLEAGKDLSPGDASSFWFRESLRYMVSHPFHTIGLYVHKTHLFWSGKEPALNFDFHRISSMIPVLDLPLLGFGLLGPIGLIGMALMFWEPRETWLVPLFVLPLSASVVLFFVADRLRFPVVPLLAVAAAFAVSRAYAMYGSRRFPQLAGIGAAALLLLIGLNVDSGEHATSASSEAIHHHNLARAYAGEGKLELAESEYRKAIAADPSHTESLSNLGNLLLQQKRFDEALSLFRQAREHEPTFPGNSVNIGNVHFMRNELAQAEKEYRAAVALDAQSVEANFNLGKVLFQKRDFAEAEKQFLATIRIDPTYAEAHFMLGGTAMQTGRWQDATSAFSTTCRLQPNHPSAWYYLCLATVNTGRLDDAQPACERAAAQGHTLPEAVRKQLESAPPRP